MDFMIEPERKIPVVNDVDVLVCGGGFAGVAAAVAMIAIVNTQDPAPQSRTEPAYPPLELPNVDWNAKSAVLVGPLQQEYENLQADLKKAEKALKEDIGL